MQGGERIGRYELLERLGRGASAEVWRAHHAVLGSQHAVKILTVSTPQMARRLLREGRVQARLRHPNIVPVTDLVQQDETIALVMELIEGGSLLDRVRARGPLRPDRVRAILGAVLDGLDLAHRAGVLHRDLKLANVLMDGDVPRIADFGLARTTGEAPGPGMTRAGQTMGTPGYMPPEQWADPTTIDARADLFALGVITYELLSGSSPFCGETPTEVLGATMAGRYTDLRQRVPDCPEDLAAAVDRALEPERADRFADCRAMAAALSLTLSDRPAPALPEMADEDAPQPEPPQRTAAASALRDPGTLVAASDPEINIDAGPGVMDGGAIGRIAPDESPAPAGGLAGVKRTRQIVSLAGLALALAAGGWWLAGDQGPEPDASATPEDAGGATDRGEGAEQVCRGGEDQRLGYWYPGRRFRGRAGDIVTVGVLSHVRADYPTADNDWDDDAPIQCVLQPGQRVRLREDPLPSKRNRSWLALYGGDLL